MSSTTSLVPPRRLGGLLREARVAAGLELDDLIEGTALSVVELDDIEHGRRDLDEGMLHTLVHIYGVQDADLVPARSQLVIDLDEGRIGVNHTDLDVDPLSGPDAVLARYLALVYRLRGLRIGASLPLRDVDLEVLATALELEAEDVETRLHRLIGDEATIEQDQRRIRRQLLLPLVGVVIAATAVGTLVLVAEGEPPADPTQQGTDIGTAAIEESTGVTPDIGNGGAVLENPSS
ncbi:MAG: helix-turn-helix domain-containing protein [Acidimicrobiales bacterium]|nr:helix-turn-helix domain-containing protein [Acidimicrobiales bacterium]